MNLQVNNFQLSVFGKFDGLEATPETVATLFSIFGEKGYLPSYINVFQVNPQTNEIKPITMPQFSNPTNRRAIAFLTDRIDIKVTGNTSNIEELCEIYKSVIESFKIKISRVALNVNATVSDFNDTESEQIKSELYISKKLFPFDNCIEGSARCVSRKKCSESIDEEINICENLHFTKAVKDSILQEILIIELDINTLAEDTRERFDETSLVDYFESMKKYSDALLASFKGDK